MENGKSGPPMGVKALALGAVVLAVTAILLAKRPNAESSARETVAEAIAPSVNETPPRPLPKLVDLGASKCVPCKMMAPILEKLERQYEGRMEVVFIDVWENTQAGKQYGVRVIPTQIFFAPDGEELFRHEGFFSEEEILAKWREFGYDFSTAAAEG